MDVREYHRQIINNAKNDAGGWISLGDKRNRPHFFRNKVSLCGRRVLLNRMVENQRDYWLSQDHNPRNCTECQTLRGQEQALRGDYE